MELLLPGESREKKRAALLSVGSAVLLVSLKSFLVIRTGSLGVLSEALHSGLDLIAAVITFLSVRVSDQPADEKHPYGHGKFENFSAFVETGLLLLTALYSDLHPDDCSGNRFNAGARAFASGAEVLERSAGSGRAAFFYGRVEH